MIIYEIWARRLAKPVCGYMFQFSIFKQHTESYDTAVKGVFILFFSFSILPFYDLLGKYNNKIFLTKTHTNENFSFYIVWCTASNICKQDFFSKIEKVVQVVLLQTEVAKRGCSTFSTLTDLFIYSQSTRALEILN